MNDQKEKILRKIEDERQRALKDALTCRNKYYIGKAYGLQKAKTILCTIYDLEVQQRKRNDRRTH